MEKKPYPILPDDDLRIVSEPSAAMPRFSDIYSNQMHLISTIRRGLLWSQFVAVSNEAPFTEAEWAAVLDISTKTMQRYRSDVMHTFSSLHSEKILQIGEVMHTGAEVFNGKERFGAWLRTPCYALAGEQPIKLITNAYGAALVMQELARIDHGILS